MAVESYGERFSARPESRAALSGRHLALLALALAPLLLAAWQLKPLYYDNQNTKYLHALANAGFGFLHEDWLARTKDGLPLFTFLLEAIFRGTGPAGFYLALIASYGIFVLCALLVYRHLSEKHDIPALGLAVVLALIFALGTISDVQRLTFQGFAEQYILSGYFQTADFGVLLLLSVLLFVKRFALMSIVCILAAAAMHPGYVAPGATLIAIFCAYDVLHPRAGAGSAAKALKLAVYGLGLIALAALAYTLNNLFAATDTQTQMEAHRVLTDIRIPRHAAPSVWLNQNAAIQAFICLLAAWLLPPGRLRFVIRLGTAALALFTLLALLPGTQTYRLVAPWRISVVLVPLATLALCAIAVVRMNRAGWFQPSNGKRAAAASLGAMFVCVAAGSAFSAAKFLRAEPAYRGHVRANLASGQHYLTPPGLADFRLATGAPQYVTFKSHPYQDVEVLEWHRRLKVAHAIYRGETVDCEELRAVSAQDAVTHILITKGGPALSCSFATQVFEEGGARIFSLSPAKP